MSGELEPIIDNRHGEFDEEEMLEEIERESHGKLDYYRHVNLDTHPAIRRKKEVAGSNG